MTTELSQQQLLEMLYNSYYGKLVPQGVVKEILAHFPETEESSEVLGNIISILDRNVIHGVLSYLDSHEDKLSFLELIRDQYNTTHPIEWATLKFDNAEVVIKESVERPLLALHSALKEN